uniref:Kinesin-like protein n=1 Tax=Kalanchoe fedtschenkoi TaxID=63787 RepID=A0A7N0T518_KALFE
MSSNVTVCVRFRPLTSKEIAEHGDEVCIRCLDDKSFVFKDERGEELTFNFDKVFYSESEQASVYEFSVLPIVRDAVNAINGTIITYGQTGAGKTYTIEGPNIKESDELKKGLLQRVVGELFECMKSSDETVNYSMKLSMVEIYMEKVRDLLDLTKDNIQIKENKVQGIMLSGVTEITIVDAVDTIQWLHTGIANRAIGETYMNMASSRSHSIYILTIIQEFKAHKRVRTGKLVIVDLAGSEKVEKTGAEGKVLEEAKTINKSLSALANVVNALTNPQGKTNHIPFRDSKLTRILQDALGGNSRAALLCCCSPSPCNAPESLSTLRFGARAKYIKAPPRCNFDEGFIQKNGFISPAKQDQCERVLNKLREKLEDEDVKLLEELFILEGILFEPDSIEELDEAFEDLTSRTISSLQKAVEELVIANDELKKENQVLRAGVATLEMLALEPGAIESIIGAISRTLGVFRSMAFSFIRKLI